MSGSVVERGSCPIYNLLKSKEFWAKLGIRYEEVKK